MPGTSNVDKYQTEYKGPIGFEKKDHQTHFAGVGPLAHTADNGYEWREVRPGRWVRVKKAEK